MSIETVLTQLSHLTRREKLTVLQWLANDLAAEDDAPRMPPADWWPRLQEAISNFWEGMSAEEIEATVQAMTMKSPPSRRDPFSVRTGTDPNLP